jgi:hypothetical protein
MMETLLTLFAAHLVGDFVLQSRWIVARKRNFLVLLTHVLIVMAATSALLGSADAVALGVIFVSHLLLDALKTYLLPDRIATFIVDQLLHLAVLVGIAAVFPDLAQEGLWLKRLAPEAQAWYLRGVTLAAGVVLCVPAGGVLIGKLTLPLLKQIPEDAVRGLPEGGKYIGWLERAIVLMLVLMDEPSGIGFLFAAKSIFRFGEVKEPGQRRVAEYIIIGTFLSFGWALLVAVLTARVLAAWRG